VNPNLAFEACKAQTMGDQPSIAIAIHVQQL
jgi:hypothetical protein